MSAEYSCGIGELFLKCDFYVRQEHFEGFLDECIQSSKILGWSISENVWECFCSTACKSEFDGKK